MLNREELKELIQGKQLIQEYINLDTQLTPNGIDLTCAEVFEFSGAGSMDFSNKERVLPECKKVPAVKREPKDKFGWWHLNKGAYKVKTNEVVNIPKDLVGLAFSRTSLLRMGGFTQHGVWDAGFEGRGEFILVVDNPAGINIKQNARVAHLVFFKIDQTAKGYSGVYKNLK